MRRSILTFAAFSSVAHADAPFDKYLGSIGSASLEGDRVDVPLYHGTHGSSVPLVKVTIGDDAYLMALRTSESGISVSDRVAQQQELNAKEGNKRFFNIYGKDGKCLDQGCSKNAELAEMKIGNLSLTDVNVSVGKFSAGVNASFFHGAHKHNRALNIEQGSVGEIDGTIGLGALPEGVSWAILPSQGLVSFALDGASLIADGTAYPYEVLESELYQYGTRSQQDYYTEVTVVPGFTVAGVEMAARLEAGWGVSAVAWPEKLPTKMRDRPYDLTNAYVAIQAGALDFGSLVVPEFTTDKTDDSTRGDGLVLGSDVLAGFDIAMDRTANTITLKPSAKAKRENPLTFVIAQAMKAVEPDDSETEEAESAESAESAETESAEDEPAVPGSFGDWNTLVNFYRANGDLDAALSAAQNLVALDERNCTGWSTLGKVQFEVGDIGAAIEAYDTSSKLYHAWYDISLEERKDIEEELEKLDADAKKDHEHYPAASECHGSDAHLAHLTFAAGDLLTVESLYRERLDLHPLLALVAGTALVTQGEYANAQEPLRQAMKLGRANRGKIRLALAAVYSNQGDWESAQALFERALDSNQDVQTVRFYLDAVHAANGLDSAAGAAQALLSVYPDSAGAVYGVGYVATLVADEERATTAKEYGDAWFSAMQARHPQSAALAGARARWLSLWDATGISTQKAIRGALNKDPTNKDALIAKASVASEKGDQATADQLTLKAAQLGLDHIGYATMLTTISNAQ